jgi:hypothetical protein
MLERCQSNPGAADPYKPLEINNLHPDRPDMCVCCLGSELQQIGENTRIWIMTFSCQSSWPAKNYCKKFLLKSERSWRMVEALSSGTGTR